MPRIRKPSQADREAGRDLARMRKLLKITQRELGERLNISAQQISKYERGLDRLSVGFKDEAYAYFATIGQDRGFEEARQDPYGARDVAMDAFESSLANARAALDQLERIWDAVKTR